jgi:hypothetical protein
MSESKSRPPVVTPVSRLPTRYSLFRQVSVDLSLIAIIPAEHWHPLSTPCTLRAESLQCQTCQSLLTTFPASNCALHTSHT